MRHAILRHAALTLAARPGTLLGLAGPGMVHASCARATRQLHASLRRTAAETRRQPAVVAASLVTAGLRAAVLAVIGPLHGASLQAVRRPAVRLPTAKAASTRQAVRRQAVRLPGCLPAVPPGAR